MKRAEAVAEEASVAAVEETVAALPRSDLDNIIDGSKGFDKASADEIAEARNTINYFINTLLKKSQMNFL